MFMINVIYFPVAKVGADTLHKKLEELTDIPDLATQQNGVNITLGK